MTTKIKAKSKVVWNDFTFDNGSYDSANLPFEMIESTQSCCGVLELGEIREGKFLSEYVVTGRKADDYDDEEEKPATFKEVSGAFNDWVSEQQYGLVVCYLLDSQHNGDFGKLIRASGWTHHGSFTNPNTRRTLHHWSKTLKKAPSRKTQPKTPKKGFQVL